MTMRLERPALSEQLRAFVADGSGVLVGPPGVGKTFLLKKYCNERLDAKEPCLYLPIDKLGAHSEADLLAELDIRTSFTQYLRSEQRDSPQPVLVIDAFDAARSELAQRFVLGLVQRVQEDLKDRWRLIVSVRSYDAKKSAALQSLFPESGDSQIPADYQDPEIRCRHFKVPLLSTDEVETTIASVTGLSAIYDVAGADFRDLMRVPFNIWLAESLLATSVTATDLSTVASESQLLSLFWTHRIRNAVHATELVVILSRITARMVEEHSLSVPISEVYPVGASSRWDALLSAELLEEVRPQRQRVTFSHNILFDYAVSALLIDRDPAAACGFLADDPSRPLFLRPSVDYFFTGLWDSSPEEFWNVLWYMLDASETHVRVYARLVPAMVTAREARTVEQLAPLLQRVNGGDSIGATFLLHLLQAIRGLFKGHRDALWAELARQTSAHMQPQFAGEVAALTCDILDRALEEEGDPDLVEVCGDTGRHILTWALRNRNGSAGAFIDNVGAIWGVRLVSRTFGSDVTASKTLLASILEQVGVPEFPINYLSQLTSELPHIWPIDPDFAVDVYARTFTHEEHSDVRTDFGTPILPMFSTRRQDFSMCQFHLTKHYPAFLDSSFLAAARATVRSINGFVTQRHVARYLNPGYTIADLTDTFTFRGRPATYIRDLSYSWEAGGRLDEALSLGDQLFRRVEDLARLGSGDLIDSLLDLLAEEATVAFWWKRLLETGSRVPSIFAERLFPLVVAPPVLRHSETLHAAGLFIEGAARHLTYEQRRELEILILQLVDNGDEGEARTHRRNRLLACFPRELLNTNDGRQLRADMEALDSVPKNEPLVRMSSWSQPDSEDPWLRDVGADPEGHENQALLNATKPADDFSSKWLNERPTADAVAQCLPQLKAGFNAVKEPGTADVAVVQLAWTRLANGAETIATGLSTANGEAFAIVKDILLAGLQTDPPSADDTDSDESYTFASWSPSPATAAAQGLPWLARLVADNDVLETCEALAADPRPSVRFLAAQESFRFMDTAPSVFWRIADARAISEKSPAVQDALCQAITYALSNNRDRAVSTLSVMATRLLVPDCESDAVKRLTSIALWLALGSHPHEWGLSFTNQLLAKPAESSHALAHAVFETANYLTPAHVGGEHDQLLTRRIEWLSRAITAAASGLQEFSLDSAASLEEDSANIVKRLYGVLDEVVMRIYSSFKSKHTDSGHGNGTEIQRAQFYVRVKPLLEQVVNFANEPKHGMFFAPTAHHFMEFLEEALEYDPRGTLRLAAAVAAASSRSDYCLDSLAARETARLAERIVTDYRSVLRDPDALGDLVTLLDLFAKVGWPDALRLLWRLDEVFR